MCQNAQSTAYAILSAEEPEIKSILTIEGVANTPQATTALQAYDLALADLKNWTPGTVSQETIEVLTDLQTAITALTPLVPPTYALLINAVLAAIITVLGIVSGNSPAPAVTASVVPAGVTAAEVQADHERATMTTYAARAQSLVPFYKIKTRGTWLPERSPVAQNKACWNKAVEITGAPESFKV